MSRLVDCKFVTVTLYWKSFLIIRSQSLHIITILEFNRIKVTGKFSQRLRWFIVLTKYFDIFFTNSGWQNIANYIISIFITEKN